MHLKHGRAICNLHSCYNFAIVLHEKALVFSQSAARNFFMNIIMNVYKTCFHRARPSTHKLFHNNFKQLVVSQRPVAHHNSIVKFTQWINANCTATIVTDSYLSAMKRTEFEKTLIRFCHDFLRWRWLYRLLWFWCNNSYFRNVCNTNVWEINESSDKNFTTIVRNYSGRIALVIQAFQVNSLSLVKCRKSS